MCVGHHMPPPNVCWFCPHLEEGINYISLLYDVTNWGGKRECLDTTFLSTMLHAECSIKLKKILLFSKFFMRSVVAQGHKVCL